MGVYDGLDDIFSHWMMGGDKIRLVSLIFFAPIDLRPAPFQGEGSNKAQRCKIGTNEEIP